MSAILQAAIAFAPCFAGMAALSLAMDRHHAQATGRAEPPATQRLALRWLGWCVLALSPWPAVTALGSTVGVVAWCGWLSAGALAVACLLTWAPRRLAGAAGLAMILALLAWLAT